MAENDDAIEAIFDAWEEAILEYDRATRPILRRLRLVLANASVEQIDELLDMCGKMIGH